MRRTSFVEGAVERETGPATSSAFRNIGREIAKIVSDVNSVRTRTESLADSTSATGLTIQDNAVDETNRGNLNFGNTLTVTDNGSGPDRLTVQVNVDAATILGTSTVFVNVDHDFQWTGEHDWTAQAATDQPIVVTAHASQTADLIALKESTGEPIVSFRRDSTGGTHNSDISVLIDNYNGGTSRASEGVIVTGDTGAANWIWAFAYFADTSDTSGGQTAATWGIQYDGLIYSNIPGSAGTTPPIELGTASAGDCANLAQGDTTCNVAGLDVDRVDGYDISSILITSGNRTLAATNAITIADATGAGSGSANTGASLKFTSTHNDNASQSTYTIRDGADGTLVLSGANPSATGLQFAFSGVDLLLSSSFLQLSSTTLQLGDLTNATFLGTDSSGNVQESPERKNVTSTPYTILGSDFYVAVDTGATGVGGAATANLPAASSVSSSKLYIIKNKNTDASSGSPNPVLTIHPNGTDTIDGKTLPDRNVSISPRQSLFIISNGSNAWEVIVRGGSVW